jgi:hypothetical protein
MYVVYVVSCVGISLIPATGHCGCSCPMALLVLYTCCDTQQDAYNIDIHPCLGGQSHGKSTETIASEGCGQPNVW